MAVVIVIHVDAVEVEVLQSLLDERLHHLTMSLTGQTGGIPESLGWNTC